MNHADSLILAVHEQLVVVSQLLADIAAGKTKRSYTLQEVVMYQAERARYEALIANLRASLSDGDMAGA